ncbi:MAG TPA: LytTR family transcriptional regulator DNA-binding domain-containing protein [Bacteroidales bacterium]|nr:LytTR family transcriptional regulator DNA-binding domain-containing protein [Bacteroidales bacterium]
MKALIIDDEPLAVQIIKEFVATFNEIEIIGEYNNGFDAIKAINEIKPDLIFLDIQMPKLTGFEMLELIENPPFIIFTTAYEEFALKAFEKNAVDYLLKPFSKARFDQAILKVLKQNEDKKSSVNYLPLIENIQSSKEVLDRVVVKESGKIFIIPVSEIYFIEAADDYVVINTSGKEYVKNSTMKYYADKLPADVFVRIHRSSIININFIKEIQPYNKETHSVIMKNGKSLKTSRQGSSELKALLKF